MGILSLLLGPLAEAGIAVFTLSTYETDYLLLKEDKISLAIDALNRAGHIVRDPSTNIID